MNIVINLLEMFYALLTSLSYNDFTMAFFYIFFFVVFFKIMRDLLWRFS